jgi:hypothetical protein
MAQQPSVTNLIEARLDVAFEDETRAVRMTEQAMALHQRIRTRPLPAKAVGVAIGLRLPNRV